MNYRTVDLRTKIHMAWRKVHIHRESIKGRYEDSVIDKMTVKLTWLFQ